jgi:hypothetical protein
MVREEADRVAKATIVLSMTAEPPSLVVIFTKKELLALEGLVMPE